MPEDIPIEQIQHAVQVLQKGGIIAYPTEAVFGLGCLPDKPQSIKKLLLLKQRSMEKGLILLASELSQLSDYLCPLESAVLQKITTSWPGPTTWVLPTPEKTSVLIKGRFNSIAVRISDHPIVQTLCQECQSAIISTSANITGGEMSYTIDDVRQYFDHELDYLLDGELGHSKTPTIIKDALTNKVIRDGN